MDKRLEQKIDEKIHETLSKIGEVKDLARLLDPQKGDDKSFQYGIMVGRLYNSFYYQSRRILKRVPTSEEFSEFLDILTSRRDELLRNL
ncbi:MAG: hypothetical protein QXY22_05850 [Candidatus Nitrosotenuis sp.]|uniref:hypothetical protein n=1 Tax=Candidatus Nitrosotenuis uzonensis TaxID=1407055 RepID=UPI00064EC351|nr:hypothetical protein [Candidatus Nitrosotenuis uzonensis]